MSARTNSGALPYRICLMTILVMLSSGCVAEPAETPFITQSPSPSVTQTVIEKTETIEITPTTVSRKQTTEDELADLIRGELLGHFKKVIIGYKDDPGRIYIRWDLSTASDNETIIEYAQTDTVTILQNCWQSGASFYEVQISGWFTQTVDINGTLDYTELIDLSYSKDTLELVNWDTVRSQYIWIIADGGSVHWLLQK